jgi:hypothetical protein
MPCLNDGRNSGVDHVVGLCSRADNTPATPHDASLIRSHQPDPPNRYDCSTIQVAAIGDTTADDITGRDNRPRRSEFLTPGQIDWRILLYGCCRISHGLAVLGETPNGGG